MNLFEYLLSSWWVRIPLGCVLLWFFLGVVYIGEQKVGIVIKRFAMRNLAPGQIVALRGEAGYQADTLSPGLHFFYWDWQFRILHLPLTYVPQGEIALVVAAAGSPIPAGRILGRTVECNHFENARSFLTNGGEKGRQLELLTAGTYRINTALFTVITTWNASDHGLSPEMLRIYKVEPDRVGIVTTLDGNSIPEGEIAGTTITGHENFQNAHAFVDARGYRGLQEQVLLSGQWNLNPWFAQVEQVPMVEIPIGHVGVVISYVGQAHEDVSGVDFKHGDLVLPGHKGVWVSPLYPGKHPLNTRVMRVELVPTTNIVLNWANRTESHLYDAKLSSITVRSRDGFAFNLDVSQIIHISALEAPKVISRAGSL
ncbi:MAG TPA: SPFH domain-containing protein, partial [Verrucomicrobium sp.]|nr:SPFH domain-containing protein [Verrucomicrobium sp.]